MKAILRSINNFSCKLKQSNNLKYNISPKIRSNKFKSISGNGNIVIEDALNKNLKDYKIYGNTKQQLLPNGYTQVDYIEATGTQHIDTGVYGNLNTLLEIKASRTTLDNNNKQLAGSLGNTYSITINIGPSNLTRFGTKSYSMRAHDYITADKPSIFICNKNGITIDGNSTGNFNEDTNFTTESTLYLMGANGSSTKFPGKLYYAKIYDNNVLIRYYIPCYRNLDNEVGLYDLVNNVFYTNQGTGVFTYGSVAPTPDAPIDMVSCGDRTKNLFDINLSQSISNATKSVDGNNLTITCNANNQNCYVSYDTSNINLNKTYYFNYTAIADNYAGVMIRAYKNDNTYEVIVNFTQTTKANLNFKVPDNTVYLRTFLYASRSTTGGSIGNKTIYSNVHLGEEPYGYKIPVNVRSDNLFDEYNKGIVNGYRLTQNGTGTPDENSYVSNYILVSPNTTYTKNSPTADAYHRACFYSSDNSSSYLNRSENNTFTTPNNCKYLRICGLKTEKATTQLVEGSTVPSKYIPYYNETTNIYLDEPLRKIGDYSDYIDFINSKVVKNIGSKVYNGSENGWYISGKAVKIRLADADLTNISELYNFSGSLGNLAYCDYFKQEIPQTLYTSGSSRVDVGFGIAVNPSTSAGLFFANNNISLADFKTWLTTNNTTVDYVLATPTEEDIELPNINLIEGKNIITIGTEVYGVFEVEYYSKEIIDISNYKYNLRKVED